MDDIQYYDHWLKKLAHPQSHKIKKFLEHGCIEKIGEGQYICKPIIGYNTRTYRITRDRLTRSGFVCNCQGFHKRGDCSHVQATKLFCKAMDVKQLEIAF